MLPHPVVTITTASETAPDPIVIVTTAPDTVPHPVVAITTVSNVERQLAAAQQRVSECGAAQGEAVELLARALVSDGQPRGNPFAGFGAPTPYAITRLPVAEGVQALGALLAAVQRNKTVSKATGQTTRDVEKLMRATEQAHAPIDKLTAALHEARRARDAVGANWEAALAALKRGTRSAADDGAPQLYSVLFERATRPSHKNGKGAPQAAPSPPPTPAPPAEPAQSA
jgi:hypothetical protein